MKRIKTIKDLQRRIKENEGPTLEFKKSTGELKEGLQTLCAFLNGSGGAVLFGVRSDGTIEGQDVSDKTLRDIAQTLDRFEPPAHVSIHRVKIKDGREVITLAVDGNQDARPFTFQSRPFERVGSTTRQMAQSKYERLLIERGHAKWRWENLPAKGLKLKDLDREEILRTRELAIQQNRISPDTRRDIGEILDRLGLRINGVLTQAAQVLYGKTFLPAYTQCLLEMGRFRGTKITGEIVDNRQEEMNAFAMLREGMEFLKKTMPLGARFPKGEIFREDRFPVPLEALREILLNAVMHRDYSHYSGYVAIAVFDDKIEIISYGRLPTGITVKQLSGKHDSKPVNPLIAGAFHRTGAVEIWGRGTNRVIDACKRHGIKPPKFEERQGFVVVTFKAQMVAGVESKVESVKDLRGKILAALQPEPLSNAQVDLNPHQIEAALFAFRSPLSKGALLADEVGLGKTIEAGLVISQKWADDMKKALELDLKKLEIDIKTEKTNAKKISSLEEKVKIQRGIKEMEKRRNDMRKRLFEAQDDVELKKENLINRAEAQLSQKSRIEPLFAVRWRVE